MKLLLLVALLGSVAGGQTSLSDVTTNARIMYCNDPPIGINGIIYSPAQIAAQYGGHCELEHTPVLSAPLPDRIEESIEFDLDTAPASLYDCKSGFYLGADNRYHLIDPCHTWVLDSMDVPAIQETDKEETCYGSCAGSSNNMCADIAIRGHASHWTCLDKHRILETAEDGTHWCRRVEP